MIFKSKRSELEIIEEILSHATLETKKTRLMYQTNLCYEQFIFYLNFLLEKQFIEPHNGHDTTTNTYQITEKGKRFLTSINTVLLQVK